jgi:pilus assembly protein FimV
MSLRLNRLWLLPALLIAGEGWALGLGDIRLSSALNEPLRAEIVLLSTTPEELANLDIQLASADTFERYGIDRPLFLTNMVFSIVKSGETDGNIIRVATAQPVSEPFVTFLIEAVWSRGRLLREYTLLLDPPTFAPPPAQQSTQTLAAPSRATPADSGTIQRAAPAPTAPPQAAAPPPPRQVPPRAPEPQQTGGFDTSAGGDYRVQRGDTLWAIAQGVRPDNRLNTNQTMIAIYEANQHAFAGNINRMSAGANLRIPSADEIFRISRGDALSEVRRQSQAWGGGSGVSDGGPSLTLVPRDGEDTGYDGTVSQTSSSGADAAARERIQQLEQQIADQDSLLEVRDNELATLRDELARLRNEQPMPDTDTAPVDDPEIVVDDDSVVDGDDVFADPDDDIQVDDDEIQATGDDDEVVEPTPDQRPAPQVVATRPQQKTGIVDTILGYLTNFWVLIGVALIAVLGILVWFARRAGRDEEDSTGVWDALDANDLDPGDGESLASTEQLRALSQDDASIVVVEQESSQRQAEAPPSDTVEADEFDSTFIETPMIADPDTTAEPVVSADTDTSRSLEDTFSSDTAINLDQSDPIAEADFHMAYGLYDQAADLIIGALDAEPDRQDLLAKLSEIYFVWGNRDGFVDAAQRLRAQLGDETDSTWDKIVIMGQQIAADHELFSGAVPGAATRAVDLSFEGALDEPGELDIDFASGDDGLVSDVIDLGADSGEVAAADPDSSSIDFPFGDENTGSVSVTAQMPNPAGMEEVDEVQGFEDFTEGTVNEEAAFDDTAENLAVDDTAASPMLSSTDNTVDTPTIEQQFESLDATSELPALSVDNNAVTEIASLDEHKPPIDATAEINLDDLGLDLDALADSDFASDVMDDDDMTGETPALNLGAGLDATGRNPQVEGMPDSTGLHDPDVIENSLASTSEMPGMHDRTGQSALLDEEEGGVGLDTSLLDATGQTQILSEELAVAAAADAAADLTDEESTMLAETIGNEDTLDSLSGEAETLLAPLDDDDDEGDFDFAKTEALPKDAFSGGPSTDETGELPGIAGATDMDLDLDDLTAALKVSALSDTLDQPRDDATVEQPRFSSEDDADLELGALDEEEEEMPTQALSPEEVSADLHDARTMTEVGTKLDLARAYVDMGDPAGARSILQEVLDEGDEGQRQQAQQLLDTLPS